ncbi:MAG TPA: hypothetical protein DEO32_00225 [Ruminococcaceae bacterium]|nr:hypothetical protein [Oscillospiraceae bacterium]
MIKNWLIYLGGLAALFIFSAFHFFEQTTWNVFLMFLFMPLVSLFVSLPFMLHAAVQGLTAAVPKTLKKGDTAEFKLISKSGNAAVFPQLRVRVSCENRFSGSKKRYRKITFFGSSKKPFIIINNSISSHCGNVDTGFVGCAVFDFAGMFFIPMKIKVRRQITVMPEHEKPSFVPSADNTRVLGFKPKPGGGFSDNYELRPFRDGDSVKNVHWKVSSKYDELFVREPSLPVLRNLVIRLDLTDKPDQNDSIIARFVYTAEKLISAQKEFYCASKRCGYFKIESRDDVKICLNNIYNGVESSAPYTGAADVFIISADGEEVVSS